MKLNKISGNAYLIQLSTIVKGMMLVLFILVSLLTFSGILTSLKPEFRPSSQSVNRATEQMSSATFFRLFSLENRMFLLSTNVQQEWPSLTEAIFNFATNIRVKDPRSFLGRELPGFAIYDGEILVAGLGTDYTNMPIESMPPPETFDPKNEAPLQNIDGTDTQSSPSPIVSDGKNRIYIYFTHTRESFLPYLKGVKDPDLAYHSQINVTKIGDRLEQELEALGIGTYVEKEDIVARLNHKGLTYGFAYQESRNIVQQAMQTNRDLQYFIDIHRDSQRKEKTTITINGESYAKLAFVIGAEHPNYEKNAELAKKLHHLIDKKYKGLSRGVILKQGKETNGKFNQDLSSNSILIEFGGVDNSFEELNRTAKVFAEVFAEFYWQAEQVNASNTSSTSEN
jgi:stage II sporulation protein P